MKKQKKILIISLLRGGDVLMHLHLIKKMKEKKIEIHLLIHDEVDFILPALGELPDVPISQVFTFPRRQLAREWKNLNRSYIHGFLEVKNLIHRLREESYDFIFNMTHTELSAHLMDLLPGQKLGISYQNGDPFLVDETPWLSYFNENYTQTSKPSFSYLETLGRSLNLWPPDRPLSSPSPSSISTSVSDSDDPPLHQLQYPQHIGIHPLTSDEKKNWPLTSYSQLIQALLDLYPEVQISILGAPQEKSLLQKQLYIPNDRVSLQTHDFQKTIQILKTMDLLITSDTSVQHLASHTDTPILSIFVGSANPYKTPPFQNGALLIFPRSLSCYPCCHSSKTCDQPKEKQWSCHSIVTVKDVLNGVQQRLKKSQHPIALSSISSNSPKPLDQGLDFSPTSQVFQVGVFNNFLQVYSLIMENPWMKSNFEQHLKKIVWQICLDKEDLLPIPPYTSSAQLLLEPYLEGVEISVVEEFVRSLSEDNQIRLEQTLKLESQIKVLGQIILIQQEKDHSPIHHHHESEINQISNLMKDLKNSSIDDYFSEFEALWSSWKQSDFSHPTAFIIIKKLYRSIQESKKLLKIEKEILIRALGEIKNLNPRKRIPHERPTDLDQIS